MPFISILLITLLSFPVSAKDSVSHAIKNLPVQAEGRVQPLDTFAKESLQFISGKTKLNTQPAVDIVLSWILLPEFWNKTDFIYIRTAVLKKALELEIKKNHFSPLEILQNKNFIQERIELNSRRQNKEELSSYFKALQKLENQLALYQAVQRGILPGLAPPVSNIATEEADVSSAWLNLAQLQKKFAVKSSTEPLDKSKEPAKTSKQTRTVSAYKLFQNILSSYTALVLAKQKTLMENKKTHKPSTASAEQINSIEEGVKKHSVSKTTSPTTAELTKPTAKNRQAGQNNFSTASAEQINSIEGDVKKHSVSKTTPPTTAGLTKQTAKNRQAEQKKISTASAEQKFQESILKFQNHNISRNILYKKHLSKVKMESHYNSLNPFHWSWILYLLALIFLSLHAGLKNVFKQKIFFYGFLSSTALAFFLHGYGMLLRSLIMERPPVTNMYETVLWVPWAAVLIAFILWRLHKNLLVFVCSCVIAWFCLLLADSAPSLLGGRLTPLEAVLRSNFWLMTHVLIITMSYSAFFLAFVMGDFLLFLFIKGEQKHKNTIKNCLKSIDRCLQTGVVLLALGTVLGGIWADYSWGRFWGWDPKETWALISLLAYVALLHARLTGWIKEFGMAVACVLMFFLIVMAWYGVNYVLGQGLHSYGFGAGGVEYVGGFALLHIIYVGIAYLFHQQKKSST